MIFLYICQDLLILRYLLLKQDYFNSVFSNIIEKEFDLHRFVSNETRGIFFIDKFIRLAWKRIERWIDTQVSTNIEMFVNFCISFDMLHEFFPINPIYLQHTKYLIQTHNKIDREKNCSTVKQSQNEYWVFMVSIASLERSSYIYIHNINDIDFNDWFCNISTHKHTANRDLCVCSFFI